MAGFPARHHYPRCSRASRQVLPAVAPRLGLVDSVRKMSHTTKMVAITTNLVAQPDSESTYAEYRSS